MATFTIRLKDAIEYTGGSVEIGTGPVTTVTGGNIGLAFYPIFDDAYKPVLDGKIVDRYWNREIGYETIDLFRWAMRRRLNEIMPYYNLMYESTRLQFDPFKTIDMHTVSSGETSDTTTSNTVSNTVSNALTRARSVTSDTPQTMLAGNEDYASSASDSNGSNDSTGSTDQTNTVNGSATTGNNVDVTGYQGIPGQLLSEYRLALINVDLMVLDELEDLFMNVWDTGDTYLSRGFVI